VVDFYYYKIRRSWFNTISISKW